MRLVHRVEGDEHVLADTVETADSLLAQGRGLMFRRSFPEGNALLFRFGDPVERTLHMVFVPFDIDALWLVGDEVTAKKRLRAWTGLGRGLGDAVVELPAGAADGVEPGDVVELVE